jgi:heme/copper-type cytochrome/quinol oxidase subunit 1
MNWEMISAVGQMLGAIGVIISIVYLAAQSRNQNKESQRAGVNVLTSHWSDLNRTLFENPDLAALRLRALQSFDELDGAQLRTQICYAGRPRTAFSIKNSLTAA